VGGASPLHINLLRRKRDMYYVITNH
jgi:hypothetical protein